MTTFQDGPASGTNLRLRRAPIFLRVVRAKDGKVDALDQLTDTPQPDEELFAYIITSKPGWMHINSKKGGGMFAVVEYRLVQPQPSDAEMRVECNWDAWVNDYARSHPETIERLTK